MQQCRVVLSGDGAEGVTGITAEVGSGCSGDGGDLTIKAGELELRDSADVSASTFSTGRGGDVSINANNVTLLDSSTISACSTTTGLVIKNNPDAGRYIRL